VVEGMRRREDTSTRKANNGWLVVDGRIQNKEISRS
jgi:hypothetical protein